MTQPSDKELYDAVNDNDDNDNNAGGSGYSKLTSCCSRKNQYRHYQKTNNSLATKLVIIPIIWTIIIIIISIIYLGISSSNYKNDIRCKNMDVIDMCLKNCFCGWCYISDQNKSGVCLPTLIYNGGANSGDNGGAVCNNSLSNWISSQYAGYVFCPQTESIVLILIGPIITYLFIIFSYDLSHRISLKLVIYFNKWKPIDMVSHTPQHRSALLGTSQ